MSARKILSFENALCTVKTNHMAEVSYYYAGKAGNLEQHNKYGRIHLKIIAEGNFNMKIQQHKVNTSLENLKEISFTNDSKLVPLASLAMIHPVVRKKIIYRRNTKCTTEFVYHYQFVTQWKKLYAINKFFQY